jgi:hypothetical protein
VCSKFLSQALEGRAKVEKFGMVLSVDRTNLIEERVETSNLFTGVLVVCVLNVGDQVT